MNYDDMRDFEINKWVVRLAGMGMMFTDSDVEKVYLDPDSDVEFNPCHSWSDAGPIIADCGISIIKIKYTTLACLEVEFDTVCLSPDGSDNGVSCFNAKFESYDVNPLRAAMIAFLKMKDSVDAI